MWTLHCGVWVTFCRRGENDCAAGIAVSIHDFAVRIISSEDSKLRESQEEW